MKLRTALKAINDVQYLITGIYGSKYQDLYLKVDYLSDLEESRKSILEKERLEKENPEVKYITYNHAVGCIEIDIK